MSRAEGVLSVETHRNGTIVEGDVYTKALRRILIGIDDTDSREDGATFALAYALLQRLGRCEGVMPISHKVAMLYPGISEKTAGNSCSLIELAAGEDAIPGIIKQAVAFVAGESASAEWGIAIRTGLAEQEGLRAFGERARQERVTIGDAEALAGETGIHLIGGRGVIGALAAVSLQGCDDEILLNPDHPFSP